MFGSNSKQNGTLRAPKNDLPMFLNDSASGLSRSFIPPKITSTPLHSNMRKDVFVTPPRPMLFSPQRRYSLSEIATPPRPDHSNKTKNYTSGPLLASTKYDVSVSTYEDTKSPGLAGRVVLYNEEVERNRERQFTHQERYSTPGLFPIVHLFKKKPPSLSQMRRGINVRIHSPDRSRNHSEEYNRKLLQEIVRPIPSAHSRNFNHSNERDTRSVLDALKEISRKRIHSNEEYDLDEDNGKRLRTEILSNGVDSNKRQRDDCSPDKSDSPNKESTKKICIYDEYAASCSSMDFSTVKRSEGVSKRKNTSTSTEISKDPKVVKLISVETQTAKEQDSSEVIETEKTPSEENKKENGSFKVLDNVPLETMRKTRLSALIGTLTGDVTTAEETPEEAPVSELVIDVEKTKSSESVETIEVEKTSDMPQLSLKPPEPKTPDKPLVSILTSSKNVSPAKHDKHVHFSIPETQSCTQTSTSIATPIVSVAVSDTPQFNFGPPKTPVAPPSLAINLVSSASSTVSNFSQCSGTVTTTSAPSFQFDSNKSFDPPKSAAVSDAPQSSVVVPPINFGLNTPKSVCNDPPKLGGFKFDLTKPTTPTTAVSAPSFSFAPNKTESSTFAIAPPSTSSTVGFGPTSVTPSNSFIFAKPAETPKSSSTYIFTKPVTELPYTATTNSPSKPSFALPKIPSFNFGAFTTASVVSSAPFATTSTSFAPSAPVFGTPTTKPMFSVTTASSATIAAPAFDTSSPFNKNPSSFGQNSAEPLFQAPNAFGAPASTAPSAFGTPQNSTFNFGPPASANSMFGPPKTTAPSFAVPTTSSFAPPAYGTPVKPSFGVTPSTASNVFGSVPQNTQVASFPSQPPAFGVPHTTAPFGTSSTTTASVTFNGGQPTFSFSSNKSNNANSFGTNNSFGSNTTTTTASSIFGSTTVTTASFGTPNNTFGATQSGGFGFGSAGSNPPAFGAPTTTTTPSFGSSTAQVVPQATSMFGGAAPSSGTSLPAFGSTATPSAGFGSANNSSFGSGFGSAGSAFGKPQTTNAFGTPAPPSFGSSSNVQSQVAPAFGQASAPAASQASGGFNFGGTAAPKPSFSFGANAEPPKANFNFTGGSSNPPMFGGASGGTAGFGGAAPPQYQPPQFNAPPGAAGVFNIGSGTSSRPRTKLQGKRRT